MTAQLAKTGDDLEDQYHATQEIQFFVNAPAHLFVSVRLAKALPQLFESTIVGSYTHHLPGAICKTWPHCAEQQQKQDSQPCTGWVVFPRSLLRGVLLALQVLITFPYSYQRIILRFALPVLFSGACSMFYTVLRNSIALIIFGVMMVLGVVYIAGYMYLKDSATQSQIVPVMQTASPNVADMEVTTFRPYEPEIQEQERLATVMRAGRSAPKSSLGSSDLETPSPPTSEGSVRSGSWESNHTDENMGDNNHKDTINPSINDIDEGSSEDVYVSSEDTLSEEERSIVESLTHQMPSAMTDNHHQQQQSSSISDCSSVSEEEQ